MSDIVVTFAGWAGTDVTLEVTPTGVPVASFRVAATPRTQREGAWVDGEPVWHRVKAWRSLAENLAPSVRQGDPVIVSGRLIAETWVREDNTKSTKHVVVATRVGHDLSRGTAVFTKVSRNISETVDELAPSVEAVDELEPIAS